MSERGSFVTEYIYCDRCLEVAKRVLLEDHKYLKGVEIPMWGGGTGFLPIIAGKVGGMYSGEEIVTFEHEIAPELAKEICHPMRIAVLAESGQRIFEIKPGEVTPGGDDDEGDGS